MNPVILVSLILLLVCTAAGLIFLAVTVSDNDDKDDEYEYEDENPAQTRKTGGGFAASVSSIRAGAGNRRKTFTYTKRSDVDLWGKKTRIVNTALKNDFEKTLAEMDTEHSAAPVEPVNLEKTPPPEPLEPEQEFIDVLDLIPEQAEGEFLQTEDAEEPEESTMSGSPVTDGLSETEDEFLIGEELLR